jgi:integrase
MRGNITRRGKKSWRLQVFLGKGRDGKPERYFETVTGIKRDADDRLSQLLAEFGKGSIPPRGKLTLAEHLKNWLDGYVKTNCSQRTYDGYQSIATNYLIPALGHHQLTKLSQQHIQAYYGKAVERLSSRTVHHQHRVLSQALKYAVRQGCLGRNPCDLVDPPSPKGKSMRTLTQSEVTDLLIAAQDNYYYPVIYTAVSTGLRQAELLGLRWRDIDIASRSISVNRTLYKRRGVCEFIEPKTPHSRRKVSMTSKLAGFLAEYKLERERLYYQIGKTTTLDDLVFATIEGKPLNPPSLSREFARIVRKAGLENVRFHDLRHTFASLMLQRGVAPKVISEALGHASVAFTMDTYSHILPGMQEDAMAMLDEILPAAQNGITPNYANSKHYVKSQPTN